MPTNQASFRVRLPVRTLVLNEKTLIGTILALFVVLHVLAGTLLQRAETEGAVSRHDLISPLYD